MDYNVTANNFDNFRHFCQWVKTISGTSKSLDELEKDDIAKRAWEKIEMKGEIEINPALWYVA